MNTQDQNLPTDILETMSSANPSTPDGPEDSPTSEFDAGLDDELSDEAEIGGNGDQALSGEAEEGEADEYSRREIRHSARQGECDSRLPDANLRLLAVLAIGTFQSGRDYFLSHQFQKRRVRYVRFRDDDAAARRGCPGATGDRLCRAGRNNGSTNFFQL